MKMHPLETQIQALLDEMEELRVKLTAIKGKVRDMERTLQRYDDMLEMSSCQRY